MKKDGFKIPDNYFEQLPDSIMQKIAKEKKKKKIFHLSIISSVAAAILIIFVSVYTMYPQQNTPIKLDDCQISDIEYFDIEMTDIYDVCENTTTTDKSVSKKEIVDFLVNDDTDYEWILNE